MAQQISIYASWFGETDRIANLPLPERRIEIGRILTELSHALNKDEPTAP